MPLHIDRHTINARPHAHEHVHERAARGAGAGTAGAPATQAAPAATPAAVLDPSVALAVRAAAGSDVANVDAAERLVAGLRSDPGSLSQLHDAVSPDRVHALLAGG